MSDDQPTVITLDWQGPFHWYPEQSRCLFVDPVGARTGLYLWAVDSPSGYLIYYVGETESSFASRHKGHERDYRNCRYDVLRAAAFRAGKRERLYQGYLWSEQRKAMRLREFNSRRAQLLPEIYEVLRALRFFVAPLEAEQRTRHRLEWALICALNSSTDKQVASFQDENLRPRPRRSTECVQSVVSRCAHVLRGVPTEFQI